MSALDLIWYQDLEPSEEALVAAQAEAVYAVLARQAMTLSCALASRLWARVFVGGGHSLTFCQGFYEDNSELIGHTWLEMDSGSIFDPTAAQFTSPANPDAYILTDSDWLSDLASCDHLDKTD